MSRMRSAAVILAACLLVLCTTSLCEAGGLAAKKHPQKPHHSHSKKPLPPPHLPADAFLFPRPARTFPSRNADHLEPVLNFLVRHVDNQHLHTLENIHPNSQHPLKVGNAANSIAAHSLKMRQRNGHKQPFPETITVSFRAFDQDFHFADMQLDTKLYAENSKAEFRDEFGKTHFVQHQLNTYHSLLRFEGSPDSAGWAVVTLAEDGLMTATIHAEGETYQINPLFVHLPEIDGDEVRDALTDHAVHNMVVTKHSDMPHLMNGKHTCGTVKPRGPVRQAGNFSEVEQITMDDVLLDSLTRFDQNDYAAVKVQQASIEEDDDSEETTSPARRRLMAYPPGYGITLWTNCYNGDQTAHKISVGVAVDYGYFAIYGTLGNVQNSISNAYASVNAVYMAQFDTFLEIGDSSILSVAGGPVWNRTPDPSTSRCASDINTDLNDFTAWRTSTKPTTMGLWHLLTNCYPAPGTVGLAWVGVMCSSQYGAGVTSWTTSLWLTVAHETGHNFGAQHTFQNGQGTTGGIMDYGDGTYPVGSGIYQFNSQYNQPEICKEISSILTTTGFTPYCWAAYAPVCGNNVVENGEDCDDSTSCCSKCKLTGQCTQGANGNTCCTSTCTWAPTTTSCNNGLGYCGNGACVNSICSQYGLTYCGLTAEGCNQQCQGSGYSCTSGWTTPNCKLTDGFVCKTSAYSTCSTGKCVASTPPTTYSWKTSNPTACSCSGTYTQTVSCVSSAGATVANSYCSGTAPSSSGTCTAPSSCYSWSSSAWSSCSVDCGTSTQTRSTACVSSSTGATVSSSQCTSAAPATQQSCTGANGATCPTKWKTSGFSTCTVSCGGGTQTQSVQCVQTQNGLDSNVAASNCASPAPATQQSCNTPTCQDGQLVYSAWSTCSVSCGGGTQSRTVSCASSSGTPYSDMSHCSSQQVDALSQNCNTQTCPNYQWYAPSTWGTCSATCGGGTQTRTAICYDAANDPNHTVAQNTNLCTFSQPATLQSCNTPSCPVPPNYVWSSGSWSTCSATCGGGTSTRTVTCINSVDNSVQPDASCTGTKPATTQACAQQGCPTYSWVASGFSACTVSCGGGTQTQTVKCQQDGTTTVVANSQCTGTQPATQQPCNTAACPPPPATIPPHTWVQGTGSPCSVQCNGGTTTYNPQCYRTDVTPNTPIGSGNCSDIAKPATSGSCNTQTCPTYWYTGPFSACSAACGGTGVQTRTVSCFYSTDNPSTATPLADSACTASKPATSTVCNTFPCPSWQYSSPWSGCSARCNQGVQTRNVSCVNYDGTTALNSACVNAVAPPVTQSCMIIPCPHWHRNLWSDCSKPCADNFGPGTQNRTVLCRMPHDDPNYYGIVASDDSLCPDATAGDPGDGDGAAGVANGKPPVFQTCNTDACPSYYWLASKVSACSSTCGPSGTKTTTYVCTNAKTGAAAASANLCLDAQPPAVSACNTGIDCPIYNWVPGNWTDCNAFCGAGKQTRTMSCRNSKPDPSIHFAYVDVDPSICTATLGAAPPTSQDCLVSESICWGTDYLNGGLKNGRCDGTSHTCVCRSGYSGATCQSLFAVSNVKTNGDIFSTAGVPLGQPLVITWNSSTTTLPFVNIVLLRAGSTAWPTGQYLATNLVNANTWTWTVGSILKDGLDPGSGYSIRVWYSKNSYADSASFTIADPCAYVTCGSHGTCSSGQCVCSDGYTGDTCGTGPCERFLCDTTTSSCNNTNVIASGAYLTAQVCPCNSGYTGSQCKTPPSCASNYNCKNGGDLGSVVQTATTCSGTCVCRGNWMGASCDTCSLQCLNGGKANSDCSACESCNAGFMGKSCECKYYLIGFRLNIDVRTWYDPANPNVALTRFSRTFSYDIMNAVAKVTTSDSAVSLDSITPNGAQVDVKVRLSLQCASTGKLGGYALDSDAAYSEDDQFSPFTSTPFDVQAFEARLELASRLGKSLDTLTFSDLHGRDATGSDNNLNVDLQPGWNPDAPVTGRKLLQSASVSVNVTTLLSVYDIFFPFLSDVDSPFYQGQVTSQADVTYTPTATDPSGQDKLAQPSQPADCFQTVCAAASGGGGSGGSGTSGDDSGGSESLIDKVKGSKLYIGLFFGGCALVLGLIILGIVCCVRASRAEKDASTALSRINNHGQMENEMTSNPALAAINNSGRWNQI